MKCFESNVEPEISVYGVVVFESTKGYSNPPTETLAFSSLKELERHLSEIPMRPDEEGRLFITLNGKWHDVWGFGAWTFKDQATSGTSGIIDWVSESCGGDPWWIEGETVGFVILPLLKKAFDETVDHFDVDSFAKKSQSASLLNSLESAPSETQLDELFRRVEEFIMENESPPLFRFLYDAGIEPVEECVHLLRDPDDYWYPMDNFVSEMRDACIKSICSKIAAA